MSALARKLDNVSTAADTRASRGRSAEIILLDSHRSADIAMGCECAIPDKALDHIGADMTPAAAAKARAERHRRARVALRRQMFDQQPQQPMQWPEWIGHELAVRIGAAAIVGALVALAKGWI
ncbi:MAG: hypothetical protein RL260_423 [Pseudomonadota bacterium]|jgi:adenylate kinase